MAAAEDGTLPPTPEAPEVDPGEAAVLFAAGYSAEDIADMNPDERAAEAEEARDAGRRADRRGRGRAAHGRARRAADPAPEELQQAVGETPRPSAPAAPPDTAL